MQEPESWKMEIGCKCWLPQSSRFWVAGRPVPTWGLLLHAAFQGDQIEIEIPGHCSRHVHQGIGAHRSCAEEA